MTSVTQAVGAILVALGVVFYIVTAFASLTALIPAAIGVVILILGLVARRASAHQHAIHGALVVALLGALGSIMGLMDGGAAAVESALTIVVCVAYIALGVRSFVAARRAREAAGG